MPHGHATHVRLPLLALALLAGHSIAAQPDAPADAPLAPQSAPEPELPTSNPESQPDQPTPNDSLFAFDAPFSRGWTIRLEPAYWYAAPRGEITLPGSVGPIVFGDSTFDLDDEADLSDLDADDPTSAFLARAHFTHDRWRFSLGFSTLSTTGEGPATAPGRLGDAFFTNGDSVETDFDMTTFDVSASYIILHGPKADSTNTSAADPNRFRFTLELLAGARFENISVDINVEPGTEPRPPELGLEADASELFGQPIAGTRLSMDIFDDITIEVGLTVGYWSLSSGSTASTWDILAAFTWRPIDNLGIEFGYQYLGLTAEREVGDGSFEFEGSTAGLFGGLALQF